MTKKINNYDFLLNPFSIKLLHLFSESTKNFEKRNGYISGGNNYEILSSTEKYLSDVFRVQSDISQIFEQLRHIRIYVQRYPLKAYYMNHGITQLDYIQYHIEAMIHKIHTIQEIMRLLINEVYKLELLPQNCSWRNLTKKISVTEKPMILLTRYASIFANIIAVRHLNSHRGYYKDADKDKIEINYGLNLYKFEREGYTVDEKFKEIIPLRYAEYFMKQHKKNKLKLIDEIILLVNVTLKQFLTSLETPFNAKLNIKA